MAIGIGDTLREARRQQGATLSDAAAETRVRESYLAALEEENFAALGGDVYVKGFLKNYARFLGLDPEPLLQSYRDQYQAGDEPARLGSQPLAPMPAERPSRGGSLAVLAVVVVVVLALVGLFTDGETPGDEEAVAPDPVPTETTPPPVANLPATDAPQPDVTAQPTPTPTPTPTVEPTPTILDEVNLDFAVDGGESWVRVVVDGAQQYEGIREDGFSETYSGDEVSLRIGDAGVVNLTVNGRDLGEIGSRGQVVVVTCQVGAPDCDIEVVA